MERRQKYSNSVRESKSREMSSSPSFSSFSTAAAAAAAARSKPARSPPSVRGGRIWNRQGQLFPPVEPGSVFLVAPWTKGVTSVAHAVSERNRAGAVVRSGPGKGLTAAMPFRVIVGGEDEDEDEDEDKETNRLTSRLAKKSRVRPTLTWKCQKA